MTLSLGRTSPFPVSLTPRLPRMLRSPGNRHHQGLCRNDRDGLGHKSRHCRGNIFEGRPVLGSPNSGSLKIKKHREMWEGTIITGQQDASSGRHSRCPRCWRSQSLRRLPVMLPGKSHLLSPPLMVRVL